MPPLTVGPYKLIRELGRGGMGVVSLATDTRLDRQVAIKALPEDLAADPDRLARFQREAKVLASLNHPHIGGIHGLEEHSGLHYLILEYIEGETLADRLKRGPIPLDEALELSRQIAEALEAAHDKGIVHRDIKPGNVMVTHEGSVKVLDFGLARTADGAPSSTGHSPVITQTPTLTTPAPVHSPTIPGVIMGTAGYMSPEQARGKPVDKRSDIFSFGCVLFEMLTGAPPFPGETATDSIGAILHRDPDWALLPPNTPGLVQVLLRRCLSKDRKQRLHDIGDARVDLDAAIRDPAGSSLLLTGPSGPVGARSSPGARWLWLTLAAAACALAASLGWFAAKRTAIMLVPPIVRFDLELPPGHTLPDVEDSESAICTSPAGDKIVFAAESEAEGTTRLFIRELSSPEARPMPGTEGATAPFFSPDGRWLGFSSAGRMMKVPIAGGPPLAICEASPSAPAWTEDGSILFGDSTGVWSVSDQGGAPTRLAAAGPEVRTADGSIAVLGVNRVEAVPGADYVLANAWDGDTLQSYSVLAVSLKSGAMRPVLKNATDARFIAPDRLVFLRESSLMAVPFDPLRAVVTGEAVQVVDGVRTSRWADVAFWAASSRGTLAYVSGGRLGPGRRLIRVDPAGKSAPLMDGTDAIVGGLRASTDGREISVITLRQRVELWTYNLERRSFALVNAVGESWTPTWTPDSSALVFNQIVPGKRPQVVRKAVHAPGGAPAVPLGIVGDGNLYPYSITPDGTTLFLGQRPDSLGGKSRIVMHRMSTPGDTPAGGPIEPVGGSNADEWNPRISPDGKLLAYSSNESGRYEVYLRPYSEPGQRVQASTAGGAAHCWSSDGKRIYFLDPRKVLHAVDVDTQSGLRVSPPVKLFDTAGIATTALWGSFDALPDGGFVMAEPASWEKQPVRIRVVLNWTQELRTLTSSEANR